MSLETQIKTCEAQKAHLARYIDKLERENKELKERIQKITDVN